jgi:hypothetical protein
MNEYASVAEVKKTLELQGETFADADITRALTAASRGLDQLLDRRFWADTDATSVRYYTPVSCEWVEIDDLVTLTSVQTDGDGDGVFEDTWTQNTHFVVEPLNAAADSEPWTHLRVTARGSLGFPLNVRSVKVTGKFGWSSVPAGVNQATIILASKLVRRAREAPFGVVSIGLDSAMRIARSDPDVMFLVGDYDRTPVAIA